MVRDIYPSISHMMSVTSARDIVHVSLHNMSFLDNLTRFASCKILGNASRVSLDFTTHRLALVRD